ncbi:MAG: hypothetical protein ACK4WJ_03670 [Endomicrobiia bacterium]
MTYKESEFPQILEILLNYAKKGFPLDEIIKESYKLYKNVPIYIGIVGMCIENLVREEKKENFKKGDVIIVVDKDKVYQGIVDKIDKNGNFSLKNVKIIENKKVVKIKFKDKKLFKIEKNILQKLWPSLYFKK